MHRGLIAIASLSLGTGCFSPSYNACEVACGDEGICPNDYTCQSDGFCHQSVSEALCVWDAAVFDAAVFDASPVDAAPDAELFDAGPPMAPGDLIITEIMNDTLGVDDITGEWFEVFNPGLAGIEMQGLTIRDDGVDSIVIETPLRVPAGGFVVLGISKVGNNDVALDYDYDDFFLGNVGDEISIVTPGNTIIDRVAYSVALGFPSQAGKAMNLSPAKLNELDNDLGPNWCPAVMVYGNGDFGTPGAANSVCE